MFQEKLHKTGLLGWATAGLLAPLAHGFGGGVWYLALALGLGAGGVWLLTWGRGPGKIGKPLAFLEYLFLIFMAAYAASACRGAWRGGNWAVSLGLLALAAWAGSQGGSGCRYGPVVLLLSGMLYGLIFLGAFSEVEPQYLLPRPAWVWGLDAFLLLPGLLALLPTEGWGRTWPWALGIGLFGAVVSLLAIGVLSPQVAGGRIGSFFEMAQGLRPLGISARLEALVSAGMTMGWFCLLSLLLALAGEMGRRLFPKGAKGSLWVAAALAALGMFWAEQIPGVVLSLGALLLWGVVPLLASRKKSANFEK